MTQRKNMQTMRSAGKRAQAKSRVLSVFVRDWLKKHICSDWLSAFARTF